MREQVQESITALKATVQAQAVVHSDETGRREDGRNGYVWCLGTGGAAPVRYYEYDPSRNRAVMTGLLHGFGGHLLSDF